MEIPEGILTRVLVLARMCGGEKALRKFSSMKMRNNPGFFSLVVSHFAIWHDNDLILHAT
jgi:hypothetical protein